MNCQSCGDVGMIRVPWADAPDDFAICLCDAGTHMRRSWNQDPATAKFDVWQLWAAREQVDPSRIYFLEEILTAEELAERGFLQNVPDEIESRESVLLTVGKKRPRIKL